MKDDFLKTYERPVSRVLDLVLEYSILSGNLENPDFPDTEYPI